MSGHNLDCHTNDSNFGEFYLQDDAGIFGMPIFDASHHLLCIHLVLRLCVQFSKSSCGSCSPHPSHQVRSCPNPDPPRCQLILHFVET